MHRKVQLSKEPCDASQQEISILPVGEVPAVGEQFKFQRWNRGMQRLKMSGCAKVIACPLQHKNRASNG